jgi:hypothetical protein
MTGTTRIHARRALAAATGGLATTLDGQMRPQTFGGIPLPQRPDWPWWAQLGGSVLGWLALWACARAGGG